MWQQFPRHTGRVRTGAQRMIGVLALVLGGCVGFYGGTAVTPTESSLRINDLPQKSITMLAIAPVALADRTGNLGDVARATLDAYTQLHRAVQRTQGTPGLTVLTPLQFPVALDPRMTEHEREADLVHAAQRVGASHVLVLESGRAEGGAFGFSQTLGLAQQHTTLPVSVKILGVDAERTLWREDFTVTVQFSVQGVDKSAVRGHIVGIGVTRFLQTYGL